MDENSLSKKRRLTGLITVTFVAFSLPILNSTLYFLAGTQDAGSPALSAEKVTFWFLFGIIFELIALVVLVYVLSRQGRTLRDLGFNFSWKDFPVSLLLALVAYAAVLIVDVLTFYLYYFATGHAPDQSPQNVDFMSTGITVAVVLLICLNPFYEELIARAFVITEVEFLTGQKDAAVIVSVALQTAYHLYQGIFSALALAAMFLVFSLYYTKRKRILPVILAHLYFDMLALILSARS